MTTVLEALNTGLRQALEMDERVVLLGEDILDPYGGAFKVTRGLSTAFPERVLAAPVSEAGMVGFAVGMALRGLHMVVEIMFADFTTLIADQLINHAARLRGMYHDQVSVPLVVRTPAGGRRGYGPTHSQSLEKLFMGVPGLQVVAPTHLGDPAALLLECILRQDDPVLFIEHKLLYGLKLLQGAPDELETNTPNPAAPFPVYRLRLRGAPAPVITLAAYGYMAELARQAMLRLAYENEIFCELVVPTRLAPFNLDEVLASVRCTGRLLTVEEGTSPSGWGAEVLAQAASLTDLRLLAAGRVAARDLTIASAPTLEGHILPGVRDIIHAVEKMV